MFDNLRARPVNTELAVLWDVERIAQTFPHNPRVNASVNEFFGSPSMALQHVRADHPLPFSVAEFIDNQLLELRQAHAVTLSRTARLCPIGQT